MKNRLLIKLFSFDEYIGHSKHILSGEYDQGIVISDLLKDIGIPQKAIGIVTVNGQVVTRNYILNDKDEINV